MYSGVLLRDAFDRPLRDLRISVTDRCNFRCGYCMPNDRDYHFMPRTQLLTFEEIGRLAERFVAAGVTKLRLTGGEPLLRRELERLVALLSAIPGVLDLALTTNGFLLAKQAAALASAGLQRVTLSLDSLDPETFAQLSGRGASLEQVIAGMRAVRELGMILKVNCVVQRGINDGELEEIAAYFRGTGTVVRFIEFMDVGNLNGWQLERVVPGAEIAARLHARWPCEPLAPTAPGEVARRYRYLDGQGEFGLITSVTQPFCRACSRARLSADGQLFTCLFASKGHDLKTILRTNADDQMLDNAIRAIWSPRTDRYSEERGSLTPRTSAEKIEMFHIGG